MRIWLKLHIQQPGKGDWWTKLHGHTLGDPFGGASGGAQDGKLVDVNGVTALPVIDTGNKYSQGRNALNFPFIT